MRGVGHKTLAMTERYAHLSDDHLLEAVRTLDREVEYQPEYGPREGLCWRGRGPA